MERIILIKLTLFLFLFGSLNLYAEENVFEEKEHCLAYRTEKTLFFFTDVDVVGKSCKIGTKTHWSEDHSKVQFEVSVPINSFDSGIGQRDKDVLEILRGDQYPNIRFISNEVIVKDIRAALKSGELPLPGVLDVAGNSFTLIFPLKFSEKSGNLIVEGEVLTKFSDFKVQVPDVGPGGMLADPGEYLEILIHLNTSKISGIKEILGK